MRNGILSSIIMSCMPLPPLSPTIARSCSQIKQPRDARTALNLKTSGQSFRASKKLYIRHGINQTLKQNQWEDSDKKWLIPQKAFDNGAEASSQKQNSSYAMDVILQLDIAQENRSLTQEELSLRADLKMSHCDRTAPSGPCLSHRGSFRVFSNKRERDNTTQAD